MKRFSIAKHFHVSGYSDTEEWIEYMSRILSDEEFDRFINLLEEETSPPPCHAPDTRKIYFKERIQRFGRNIPIKIKYVREKSFGKIKSTKLCDWAKGTNKEGPPESSREP